MNETTNRNPRCPKCDERRVTAAAVNIREERGQETNYQAAFVFCEHCGHILEHKLVAKTISDQTSLGT